MMMAHNALIVPRENSVVLLELLLVIIAILENMQMQVDNRFAVLVQ
jgi:hypothetical protein